MSSELQEELKYRDPSIALLSSWSDYRSFARQVNILTAANLKARYRKTVAGFLWVVLNPIIMFGVQAVVFKGFLHLKISRYPLFLLSGLLPWIFMVQSIDMCTGILVNSANLLKSFQVNPLVYLFSQLTDNMVNFLAAFLLLLLPVCLIYHASIFGVLLLPLPLITLAAGTFGLCWLLAVAQVFFRDTRFIVQFVTNIGFFLTPIFYSPAFVPKGFRWMIVINPFNRLLLPFRDSLMDFQPMAFAKAMVGALCCSGIVIFAAILLWKKKRNAVYFNI